MKKSYVLNWVHVSWTTHEKEPLLNAQVRPALFQFIRTDCYLKKIYLDVIHGDAREVHALIRLKSTQQLSRVMNHIKGASSRWADDAELVPDGFRWEREYVGYSVSPDRLALVRRSILRLGKETDSGPVNGAAAGRDQGFRQTQCRVVGIVNQPHYFPGELKAGLLSG